MVEEIWRKIYKVVITHKFFKVREYQTKIGTTRDDINNPKFIGRA